jgi:hypothetical protein
MLHPSDFFYQNGIYSVNSSKMIGKVPADLIDLMLIQWTISFKNDMNMQLLRQVSEHPKARMQKITQGIEDYPTTIRK